MIVWLNGALLPQDQARIDPMDRGLTLGDGVYETIRVRNGSPMRLDSHFRRLSAGLDLLEIGQRPSETEFLRAFDALLADSGLADAVLRLTVTRGPAARGIAPDPLGRPTVLIAASPYVSPSPVRAVVAMSTRRNEHSPLSRVKSLNCLDAVIARIEAARREAGEAVLLNTQGRIAETSAANLFAVIDGALVTPPIAEGALPGVMRALLIDRLSAEERPLRPVELASATEIFLTSSLGIRPVLALDAAHFAPGPVAEAAARAADDD